MARIRKFDEDHARDAAMIAFWRHGFDGASYDKLVAVTGASRKGLYSIWPDKAALFRDCIDLYVKRVASEQLARIAEADTPERFDTLWDDLGQFEYRGVSLNGCLICRAMSETAGAEEYVNRVAERFHRGLLSSFETALNAVWLQTDRPPGADAGSRAKSAAALAAALLLIAGCGFGPTAESLRELGRATRA